MKTVKNYQITKSGECYTFNFRIKGHAPHSLHTKTLIVAIMPDPSPEEIFLGSFTINNPEDDTINIRLVDKAPQMFRFIFLESGTKELFSQCDILVNYDSLIEE
ncbi:hypothetical protein [Telluribacter humicola]|uniref:hypothetical protein n=1 Tax=Telluribacter humicola TaxID=1720261 RepID=UPI001A979A57|nr:hypothetical protein [Telluribacter humicola]